ncbi:thiamine diphosphokinase [Leuconostocaceae bacterium ESL0958]|nr:thiamine diphosphokinase [Leuconostocaceae bacterium ESL0958]
MRINILAGGPKDLWPRDVFQQPGTWIGADRGAWTLYEQGISFHQAVGDFDSLTTAERTELRGHLGANEIAVYPPEKDWTDTGLAVQLAMQAGADEIYLYGATGGRLDHLLANLTLVEQPSLRPVVEKLRIVDRQNVVTFLLPGKKQIWHCPGMRYFGVMPVGIVGNLKIRQAKYPLTQSEFSGIMWSSNEFVSESVQIDFDTGKLLVVQSKDGG